MLVMVPMCNYGFLDATKAFDGVNYCKHFQLLMKRHLPVFIIRVLLNFYIFNFVRVSWCGFFSNYFVAVNGVKQGGGLTLLTVCALISDCVHLLYAIVCVPVVRFT